MQAMDHVLQEISQRIAQAASSGTALRIRGGGTRDFYGQALAGELLDTRAMDGITAYEPSELYVTARAGTSLAQLEALLAEKGQCLPFEPPHFMPVQALGGTSAATVGGMVASGLSGPARASAGSVRDYVLGATLVNGRGEVLTFGGQVMKNVAGYDVSRVLAGSLGTLALIAEVSLKVLPVAPAEATLRFEMDAATALCALNEWGGQPLPLNASCWVEEGGRGVLYLRLRGAIAAVEAACAKLGGERVSDERTGAGTRDVVLPDLSSLPRTPIRGDSSQPANPAFTWNSLRHQTHLFFQPKPAQSLWRLSIAQTAPVLDLPYPQLIEWHGGQRWLQAPASEASTLRAAALKAGGHATQFRAASDADKAAQVFAPLAPPLARIHRELKKQFDPAGIFNPGRMYPEA